MVNISLQGRNLMAENLKETSKIYCTPEYQLNWDLKYTVVPTRTTLHFDHYPRTPGNDVLSSQIVRVQFPNMNNTYVHQPQSNVAKGPRAHEPIIVSHSTGSRMAPTRGFGPTIAPNQQSFEPTHVVERNGERELRSGAGAVSSEETTDTPKPRMPLPRPLSHYAKEGGVPLQDQPVH